MFKKRLCEIHSRYCIREGDIGNVPKKLKNQLQENFMKSSIIF
jgi:hypothetical protein